MSITRERFESGLSYQAYKEAMTRNRDRVEANERRVVLDRETVRALKSLPQPLNVVVLAEDWCGDVIANLPVLGRLSEEVGTLNVRIFYRDQNLDLMERWLNQGKFQSIPVFAFFDER
ncbi:MAG: thioredoxin family protein, partial [Chloroflexi bacterium]